MQGYFDEAFAEKCVSDWVNEEFVRKLALEQGLGLVWLGGSCDFLLRVKKRCITEHGVELKAEAGQSLRTLGCARCCAFKHEGPEFLPIIAEIQKQEVALQRKRSYTGQFQRPERHTDSADKVVYQISGSRISSQVSSGFWNFYGRLLSTASMGEQPEAHGHAGVHSWPCGGAHRHGEEGPWGSLRILKQTWLNAIASLRGRRLSTSTSKASNTSARASHCIRRSRRQGPSTQSGTLRKFGGQRVHG